MLPAPLKHILEAALLAAGRPLSLPQLLALFADDEQPPTREELRATLIELQGECTARAVELVEVASGWRYQVRPEWAPWMHRLWQERAPRPSRALLETLALIAYRQPVTRAEIEEIRGVAVSTSIIKTLMEREWVRVVGTREVAGRPALYGTTKAFLDHFGVRDLDDLPPLAQVKEMVDFAPLGLASTAVLAPEAANEATPMNHAAIDTEAE